MLENSLIRFRGRDATPAGQSKVKSQQRGRPVAFGLSLGASSTLCLSMVCFETNRVVSFPLSPVSVDAQNLARQCFWVLSKKIASILSQKLD